MKNFSQRIAALSPGQLKLLKLRLKKEGIDFDTDIKTIEKNIFPAIEPSEEKEYYPLSSFQKRMFTLNQLEGAGAVYITQLTRIIRENLDKKKVRDVFTALIKRHESFRTSFEFINGEPVQEIHDHVEFEIQYHDLAAEDRGQTTEGKSDTHLSSVIRHQSSEFIHPFDLSQAPLLRVGLFKLEEKKYILMIKMHHIITDALSNKITWDEFNRLYYKQQLKELKIQYKDFCEWQNSKSVKAALKYQETYWLREFQGEIPLINLPTDYQRPVNKSYEGGFHIFKIDKKETSTLKALALKENTTLFVLMLSLYNIFLAKICRQKDIIVGIPIAGRRHAGLDNTIGMFVNSLALRNDVEDNNTWGDFLKRVRQRTLEAFANQDYQFEELVDQVVKQRDTSRNPIFDVFFSFRAPGVSQELPPGLTDDEDSKLEPGEKSPYQGATLSFFDLYFLGKEIKEELFLVFVYSSELFKKETIARFVGYVKEIVSAVVEDNMIELGDIKISHDLGIAATTMLQDEESDFGF
ncbi:condensation domain-containing protein [Acidobacteriota bacterium]